MEESTFTVEVPAGVEDGLDPAPGRSRGRRASGAARAARSSCTSPWPPTSASSARATTCTRRSPSAWPRPPSGTETDVETLDGPQHLTVGPGTQHGHVERIRGPRACPTCAAAAAATSSSTSLVETPGDLTPEQDELLRHFAALRGEERRRRRARRAARASSPASAPPLASAIQPAYAAIAVRAAAAAQVFVDDPAHPVLAEEDVHHLARVLRLRAGEEVDRGRRAGPMGPRRLARRSRPRAARRVRPVAGATAPCSSSPAPSRPSPWPSRRSRGNVPSGWCRSSPSWASTASCRCSASAAWCAGPAHAGEATVERLRRVAREASAQCRRVWLPEVSDTVRFADLGGLGGRRRGGAGPAERRPAGGVPARGGGGARGWVEHRRARVRACPRWGSASACCGPRRPPSPRGRCWPPCVRAPWPRRTGRPASGGAPG